MPWLDHISGLHRIFQRQPNYPDLFSDAELQYIRKKASMAAPTELDTNLEVHHKLLGEQLSPFARSGFEFAETRAYQPGDNIRFINWRRFANTGQLFVNTFHEERRPQCWILMDRRSNMRFATHFQLKSRQAALFALYYLFKAHQQQMDIGGVVLEHDMKWYEPRMEMHSLLPFIQHVNAPCPASQFSEQETENLSRVLRSFNVKLTTGCLIIICSDFNGLSSAERATLTSLASKHTVLALHIVDPIEQAVPEHGQYPLYDPISGTGFQLDCDDPAMRQNTNAVLKNRLEQIRSICVESGLLYQQVQSTENFLDRSNSAFAL